MNDMAKNLILWMIIAGVLLTVFQNINQETREDNINYSEFVREVRSGRVAAVELAGINITGWRSDNSQFRTIMPLIGDNQLMDDLFENGVEIRANEPDEMNSRAPQRCAAVVSFSRSLPPGPQISRSAASGGSGHPAW